MSAIPSKPGKGSRTVGLICFVIISLVGLNAFYQGVIKSPLFDSDRPYTGDFNALFNHADTHLAAARAAIEERRLYLAEPELGPPPPADIALRHLNLAVQHRPGNAYAWVMKARQEIVVNRAGITTDKYDEAVRALRVSNRLAPNAINLTRARLVIASRIWSKLSDDDKAEIERQVKTTWQEQGARNQIVEIASRNILARRIIRRALSSTPDKLDEFKTMLARWR